MINKADFLEDEKYKELQDCANLKEIFWINPKLKAYETAKDYININIGAIDDAENRLKKFAPLIEKIFPETKQSQGIIESPIKEINRMKTKLEEIL